MGAVRRWSNLVSVTVFSVAWGFCVLFLVLPFTASAAGVTYQTTRVGSGTYVTNGITSPITVNVAPSAGVSKYQQVRPVASPSTVGKLARGALRGGVAGVAVTGIVEGLGWAIDQATGDISRSAGNAYLVPLSGSWQYGSPIGHKGVSSTQAEAASHCAAQYCATYQTNETNWASRWWNCPDPLYPVSAPYANEGDAYRCYIQGSQLREQEIIAYPTSTQLQSIEQSIGSGLSLNEASRVLQYVVSDASPRGSLDTSQYPVILSSNNPLIQTLFSDWPELRVAYQNMLNAELAAILAASDPNFQPSPEEQVIVNNGSELPPLVPDTGQLPAFCEWASFLCEPFVDDPHPPIPILDLETPTYDSGLPSTASCPVPLDVVTGFGSWQISFQPACDLASAIRVPLTAISYLMAGFIVVGVRK